MRWAPQSLPLEAPESGRWRDGQGRSETEYWERCIYWQRPGRRASAASPENPFASGSLPLQPSSPGCLESLGVKVDPVPSPPPWEGRISELELKPSYSLTGLTQKTHLELPGNMI